MKWQLFISLTCTLLFPLSMQAQIEDPIPEAINPSGVVMELENWIQIRASSNSAPLTRINLLREVNDDSRRLFVNDLRGFLWFILDDTPQLFLSIRSEFNRFIDAPGKGTGFGAFAFHPDFAENGIFYTSHAERAQSASSDFPVLHDNGTGFPLQWVLTEWTMEDPQADSFTGGRREVIRWDFPNSLHGVQEITFNSTASPGDPDYGNLYICIGDGGSSILFLEDNLQNLSSHLGTIFRIDPLGSNGSNGKYGIPDDNPFVSETDTTILKEIWAYGFRNPHRISWDGENDHKMLIGDIGEMNIEELNIGYPGANYGWGVREGTFVYNRITGREFVYPLPENDSAMNFTYPVAMYDHDEGNAIVGGYTYRADENNPLYGYYLCGDIVSGRIFMAAADQLSENTITPLQELDLRDSSGQEVTLLDLVDEDRADLRFGLDQEGEIYILTKGDGWIRRFKSETTTALSDYELEKGFSIHPNPVSDHLTLDLQDATWIGGQMEIFDAARKLFRSQSIIDQNITCELGNLPSGIYYLRLEHDGQSIVQPFFKH